MQFNEVSRHYTDEEEAARDYDAAVRQKYGPMCHDKYFRHGAYKMGGTQVLLNLPTAQETAAISERTQTEETQAAVVPAWHVFCSVLFFLLNVW